MNGNDESVIDSDDRESTLSQRLRKAVIQCLENHEIASSSSSSYSSTSSSLPSILIPPFMLRKYIEYARRYCHPRLTKPAAKVLQRLYLTMRAQSSLGDSIPVTTRHLESLIRLCQAKARMELRDEVS